MKSFRWVRENWIPVTKAVKLSDKDFNDPKTILPAIKHKKTGKVYVGKGGELHATIAARTKSPHGKHWRRGFYSHANPGFHNDPEFKYDAINMGPKPPGPGLRQKTLDKARIWNQQREWSK